MCGATPPTPICSSICRADRGSGATNTRGFHERCSSTPTRRSRSWPSRRPSPGTSSSSAASITCSPSAPTSARPGRPCRRATSPGTRRGSRSRSTTGATAAAPGDRFTTVMTWQIESFTDVGGNKDQEFLKYHRPAVTNAAALRAGDQRARRRCCANTAGPPSTPCRCRGHPGAIAISSTARRPNSASRNTPTWQTDRAGSAIAPSVTWRPDGPRSCRTRVGPPSARRARACSRFRPPRTPHAASTASTADYSRHARRALEIAREHFDARVVLPRLLAEACA